MKLVEKNKCSGCMACLQACPNHCIKTVEDDQGNLYPEIDSSICIQCMKCSSVCPELNKNLLSFRTSKKAYAAWSLDKKRRLTSASGGIAAELYRFALDQDYWICGAEYQKDFHVIHTVTNNSYILSKFQQSKYVYSETINIFSEIREHLKNGEGVLFISLPCKVAGLKAFLGKDYKKLIVVDIVCHGTPPYRQMIEHISNVDRKHKATKISFRNNNDFIFKLTDNKSILYDKSAADDEYLLAFLNGLNYRESCYQCQYARPERIADLTICDFWGLGKETPFEHPYSGSISAVLVNTPKGEAILSRIQEALFMEERPVNEAIQGNTQLRQPSQIHPNRNIFLREYPRVGFEKAVQISLKDEIKELKKEQRKKKYKSFFRTVASFILPRYWK